MNGSDMVPLRVHAGTVGLRHRDKATRRALRARQGHDVAGSVCG